MEIKLNFQQKILIILDVCILADTFGFSKTLRKQRSRLDHAIEPLVKRTYSEGTFNQRSLDSQPNILEVIESSHFMNRKRFFQYSPFIKNHATIARPKTKNEQSASTKDVRLLHVFLRVLSYLTGIKSKAPLLLETDERSRKSEHLEERKAQKSNKPPASVWKYTNDMDIKNQSMDEKHERPRYNQIVAIRGDQSNTKEPQYRYTKPLILGNENSAIASYPGNSVSKEIRNDKYLAHRKTNSILDKLSMPKQSVNKKELITNYNIDYKTLDDLPKIQKTNYFPSTNIGTLESGDENIGDSPVHFVEPSNTQADQLLTDARLSDGLIEYGDTDYWEAIGSSYGDYGDYQNLDANSEFGSFGANQDHKPYFGHSPESSSYGDSFGFFGKFKTDNDRCEEKVGSPCKTDDDCYCSGRPNMFVCLRSECVLTSNVQADDIYEDQKWHDEPVDFL
ncbi:uncharacterized protein LOC128217090 [Mya arenaria]|uniref:uncharacterized protein LOC128217090 n=1 Tax=Mya arenaria TaxID=6604 RepID=UPI0022E77BBF|nr:uncharacterized protein LOC128217090 [Mya arenaria]